MKYPFREIDISEIENVKIGNAEDLEHATGCTVIICENGMPAGVDVRGHKAPGLSHHGPHIDLVTRHYGRDTRRPFERRKRIRT